MASLRSLSRAINCNSFRPQFRSPSLLFAASTTIRHTESSLSLFHSTVSLGVEKSSSGSHQSAATAAPATSEPGSSSNENSSSGTPVQDKFFEDVHFLGDAAGKIVIRSPPHFATADASRRYHKQHLAAAFRVFARQGFDEGVAGHISLRDPEHPHLFWINPLSKHFSQIRVSDLVLVDEKGNVLPGGAQLPINGPAFAIHSEIHKARPDVNAACHAHSVYGKAFSTFARPIEPLYQDAIRFYNDLSGK